MRLIDTATKELSPLHTIRFVQFFITLLSLHQIGETKEARDKK